MSVTFDYITIRPFSVDEILRIRDLLRHGFPAFVDFAPSDTLYGTLMAKRHLPTLRIPAGLGLWNASIWARLMRHDVSRPVWRGMCQQAEDAGVCLTFRCRFEEEPGAERANLCNTVEAGIVHGKRRICFSAGGRLARDRHYRYEFFQRLVGELDLPIRFRQTARGYLMEHTGGGEIHLNGGDGTCNHSTFDCELPGASIDETLERMERCVQLFSSGRVFRYGWNLVHRTDMQDPHRAMQVYDWARRVNWPMRSAQVHLDVTLQELSALDGLRNLCQPRGVFYMMLFAFGEPDDCMAGLYALTRPTGHYLELQLEDPEHLPRIQSILHLPLNKRARIG